ncbi:MAG: 50S ribosomal protein L4 [Oscillospiraceae bacterium]|nr:50S ribosomal protein L4 [Oscillospiraceae bacterium]
MPNVAVLDMTGKNVGEVTLSDTIFGIEPNAVVMHMAVVNYLANQRQGTQSTLTRSEVSGGGRKPWRQKGTGHARQGSIRSPQWRHGGIALGPKPRDYYYNLNKKVKRLALKSALSDKVLSDALIVLDELKVEEFSTKTVVNCLDALKVGKKTLIVLADNSAFKVKSASNIPGVKTAQINTINTYDVINADTLVVVRDAVAKLEEVYA